MNPPPLTLKRGLEIGLKGLIGKDRPTHNLVGDPENQGRMKMLGESFCYSIARLLGINKEGNQLVPETSVIAYNGKPYSMQVFEHGTIDAHIAFTPKSTDKMQKELDKKQKELEKLEGLNKKRNDPTVTKKITDLTENITDLTIEIADLSNKIESIKKFQDNLKKLNELNDKDLEELKDPKCDEFLEKTGFTKNSIESFQTFALFDFLTGNMDRHDENWLIKLTKDGQIEQIVAIDNGNSFPARHLREGRSEFIESNQYAWAGLGLSKLPLLEDVKNKFKQLDDDKIEESITTGVSENVTQVTQVTGKKVDEMGLVELMMKFKDNVDRKKCLKDRIDVLNDVIMKDSPPAELSKYKYKSEFDAFKKEKNKSVNRLQGPCSLIALMAMLTM